MPDRPRLLVSVPDTPELRRAVGSVARDGDIAFVRPEATGPWPDVEAWLVGSIERDLPHWEPGLTPRLRFVQRLFTGLDGFPFDRFPASVEIAGNVGAYAPFVAEHGMALLLALTHNVVPNWEKVRAGRLRPPTSNRYLVGQTVLILGYGEIGRAFALRVAPFGPALEGLNRLGLPEPGIARMFSSDRLHEALEAADVVVDCRPLTRATRGTIDRAALERMEPNGIYLNLGRAGTVEEGALFEHLSTHPEFRAALDVWWDEDFAAGTLTTRFPFASLPNFLGSPHVAGVGAEARERAIETAAENLGRFLRGGTPRHLADRGEYGPSP